MTPLKSGYNLSPQSNGDVEQLGEYGRSVGVAFQIKDDLLGLFGEEEETGKPITSDIKEGKRTVPLVLAFQMGSEFQKEKVNSMLGEKLSRNEFKKIREIVEKTGAKKKSEEMAGKLFRKIFEELEPLKVNVIDHRDEEIFQRNELSSSLVNDCG